MVSDRIAVNIYRMGGAISELHASNLVKLARRYHTAWEEGDEQRMQNLRIAIAALLTDAGLSGWSVEFGEGVTLNPPNSAMAIGI